MNMIGNFGPGYLGPGLDRPEDISTLAKVVLERYDKDRTGQLSYTDVSSIMIDMYRSFNKAFTPTKYDVDGFSRLLDNNKDGKIDLRDIEGCINRYLKVNVEVTKTSTTRKSLIKRASITIPTSQLT